MIIVFGRPINVLLRPIGVVLLLLAALGATGCQKTDPLAVKVSAATADGFSDWRIRVGSDLSAAEWQAFDGAVQEIKLELMAAQEATGGAAVNAAARVRIQGRAVREVMLAGGHAKLRRLGVERAELAAVIEKNSHLAIKPGNAAPAADLVRARQRQAEHLQRLTDEVAATEQKLKLLSQPAAPR